MSLLSCFAFGLEEEKNTNYSSFIGMNNLYCGWLQITNIILQFRANYVVEIYVLNELEMLFIF